MKLFIRILLTVLIILGTTYAQRLHYIGIDSINGMNVSAVKAEGNCAYVGGIGIHNLVIIDITNPGQPSNNWFYDFNYPACIVNQRDNYLYVGQGAIWYVLYFNRFANPTQAGEIALDDVINNVCISGNYAYIANGNRGLTILDISIPSNPVNMVSLGLPGDTRAVSVSGDYAFVTCGNDSLRIIDISNPASPFLKSSYNLPNVPSQIIAKGNYAYIVDGASLFIVDATLSSQPELVANLSIPGGAWSMDMSTNYVFTVGSSSGVTVIDVSDPTNPVRVAHDGTPGFSYDISVNDNYVYVADQQFLTIYSFTTADIDQYNYTPSSFSLSPNYPNPFNSSTTIRYNLPTESPVTIDIYDILGRKVQTLLDVKEQAGSHQVNWNADGMPSGAYFARLKAGEKSQTLKMILMK
jgi:hypothetical protein